MSKESYYKFPNPTNPTAELIKRRRIQVLVHSCIYYALDDNIVPDHVFDAWAKELEQLMKDHPDAYSDRFDYAFKNWDSSSGYNLPHRDPWILNKA
jgi:NAD-dependent DNA ligase